MFGKLDWSSVANSPRQRPQRDALSRTGT